MQTKPKRGAVPGLWMASSTTGGFPTHHLDCCPYMTRIPALVVNHRIFGPWDITGVDDEATLRQIDMYTE